MIKVDQTKMLYSNLNIDLIMYCIVFILYSDRYIE